MKKFGIVLCLSLTVGVFGGLASTMHKTQQARADEIIKYIPVNNANYSVDGGCGTKFGGRYNVEDFRSLRNDTFHSDLDGGRSYNALDNFINTMSGGGIGEGETGGIRSKIWVQSGDYVSFLMGGNQDNYINIWDEDDGVNLVDHYHRTFYTSTGDYPYNNQEHGFTGYELSANMTLEFFNIREIRPASINHRLLVWIEDCTTSYYGGIQFGALQVNQTLEEVARTFSVHKANLATYNTINTNATNYVLNTYYASDKYAPLRTAEAALDNANDGFENGSIINWAYDQSFSTKDNGDRISVNFDTIVSSTDHKDWTEKMPANKSDNFYINADTSGIDEAWRYKLISNEFTLSGTGIISAKLGGATAVLSLIDADGVELASTRLNEATGTNVLNPSFVDASVANIVESGSRCNTMTRTYLDCSAHVGKRVRVVLADERYGGAWGLAYFDEVITKYESLPNFKVDTFTQDFNGLKYGYNLDRYVGPSSSTLGQAYGFLQTYYSLVRPNGVASASYEKSTLRTVFDAYRVLSNETKAIVNVSQDVVRNDGTGEWYEKTLDTSGVVSTFVSGIALTYNVSFDKNGGEGSMSTETEDYLSAYELPACTFTAPANHHFAGWKVNGDGELKQPGEEITINNDLTLVAQWAIDTYQVSFNANGGSETMTNVVQDYGATYALPANGFTAPQYKQFAGWKVGSDDTLRQPGYEITITDDVEVVAQWAFIQHTVSFANGGGDGTMDPVVENEGSMYTLPANGFTAPEHKQFLGWKVNGAGETLAAGVQIQILADVQLVAQWKFIERTITFAANGGTGSLDPVVQNDGSSYELPVNPFTAPEHKQFVGWRVDGVGELLQPGDEVAVNGNFSLVAQWQYYKHTVSFAAGGGTGEMDGYYVDETTMLTLPVNGFTAPQYKQFAGWKIGSDDTIRQPGYQFEVLADVTITAQWATIPHTVSFSAGDGEGSMSDVVVEEGVPYSLPEPTAFTAPSGKMFAGWKINDAGDLLQPNASILVNAAIELVAQWKDIPIVTYTISFNANGGSSSMAEVIKAENSTYNLPANGFTAPSGKEFAGWKVNGAGDALQPGAEITITDDVELVAQWRNIKHTVSFAANGGSGTMPDTIKNENDLYTLPECAFNAPSYQEFAGWKVNGTGELLQPGAQITILDDVQLVAQWKAIEHTISFNANGGTGSMASVVRNEGTKYTLPECEFEAPANKEFAGWRVNGSGEALQPGAEITVSGNVELVAQWNYIQHTVYFNPNGGEGIMFDQHEDQGSTYVLPACAFEAPANKEFIGWKVNGTGDTLQPGAEITITADVELVAQWQTITHTITFTNLGGSGIMDPVVKDQGSTYVLPECGFTAPENMEFAGWKVGDDTTVRQPGYEITVTGDVTITALWSMIEHTISFDGNGAEGSMANDSQIQGIQYTLPECGFEAPANQEFIGWKVNGTGELLQPGAKISLTSDIQLVAQWAYIQHEVSFNGNGAQGSMGPVQQNQGATYVLPACEFEAPENKEFKGWLVGSELLQPGAEITISDDVELVAQWAFIQHTVSFNGNGAEGSMANVNKDQGSTYVLPACEFEVPANKEFTGWKLGNDVLQPGAQITVSEDVELVAQWAYIQHEVSFNGNGAEGSMASVPQNQGAQYTLPECEFEAPANKEFTGWLVGSELKQPGEKITISDDVELVAQWDFIKHTVSFNGNGAEGTMADVEKDQGATYVLPQNGFEVPENKEFVGWKVGNDVLQPGAQITVSEDVELVAQWAYIQHTVSFNGNGGTESMDSVQQNQGATYVLPQNGFTAPENKEFVGWKVGNEVLQPGAEITITGDVELVAQWRTITHVVSFNGNGGTGTMADVTKDQGSTYVLPESTFVAPTDKEFAGWKVNGQGELLQPGAEITISGDVQLVAQWNDVVKYIISFDGNGGTGVVSSILVDENAEYTLPGNGFTAPEGKEFAGWKVNGEGELLQPGSKITVSDDVQLVAQWKDLPAPVDPEPVDPTPVDPEPVEPEPTEPENPTDGGGEETPEQPAKKGGCGGSVIATSAIISLTSLLGAGLLLFKKKKED